MDKLQENKDLQTFFHIFIPMLVIGWDNLVPLFHCPVCSTQPLPLLSSCLNKLVQFVLSSDRTLYSLSSSIVAYYHHNI